MQKEKKMSDVGQQNRKGWQSILSKALPWNRIRGMITLGPTLKAVSPVALHWNAAPRPRYVLLSGCISKTTPPNFARHTKTFSLRFRLSFQ